jgi:hypothetical protein
VSAPEPRPIVEEVLSVEGLPDRGAVSAAGTPPLERRVDPDLLFGELEARGCSFTVEGT